MARLKQTGLGQSLRIGAYANDSLPTVKQPHYETTDCRGYKLKSWLNVHWLRINGVFAYSDTADVLPWDHTGDSYLGTTSIPRYHDKNPKPLELPRSAYRRYVVRTDAEISLNPEIIADNAVIGGDELESFRKNKAR